MSSFAGVPYGLFLDTDSCRVSIDNIRLKFCYKFSRYSWRRGEAVPSIDSISSLLDVFDLQHYSEQLDVSWSYKDFFKIGAYCRTATIAGLDWSCAVLIGRYCFDSSCKQVAPEAVFDFNPNKVPMHIIHRLVFLLRDSAISVNVLRYDVAFDFPLPRDDVVLVRGDSRRSYRLFLDGGGKTEYLGARSSHGSLKLYDKTAESSLSVPVTRAEVTVEAASFTSIRDVFPSLYCFSGCQLDFSFSELPFQVHACVMYPELIPVLRSKCSAPTYRKYMSQISSLSQAVLTLDFSAADCFISSALTSYLSVVIS